ncbi:MAG: FG-GAP-like repeat-containing protein, partial [Anaerolineae bacterium]
MLRLSSAVAALSVLVLALVVALPTASAQSGGLFSDSGQVIGDETGNSVALADLDADGDEDLFAANTGANRIWINQGGLQGGDEGTFVMDPGQSLGSSISRHVALGDLDGDGDADAFVANGSFLQTANRVWLNDGSGVFSDSGQSLGNAWTEQVALGDLDGDGDLDAVAANFYGSSRVWTNQGGAQGGVEGVFGSGPGLPGSSLDVALADFDLDGDLDAALLDDSGARVSFWW